ncbi:phosphate ABC transporter substrate-binding protein PstS family protein [Aquihabitans daechungensis]|uniref:phosphate ABC transporter substrate-binding protein PstS family protein n=1 Tax=Aquihabitans daechungensis TaxID=1052257 RepID=UPI003B9E1CE4
MISKKRQASVAAALFVPVLLLGACGPKTDDPDSSGGSSSSDLSGEVVVSGSSTVAPISNAVREAFIAENGDVDVTVDGPGTGDGFKLFCDGETDISDASRPIKEEEATTCEENGIEFIELPVAIDGLSVITAEDNPLDCLNYADLYALTGPESEGFDSWTDAQDLASELGSDTEFPDENLVVTAPGSESGTYDSFIELVLAGTGEARLEEGKIEEDQAETTRADYSASPDDNVIIEGVSGDPGGLGWVGFAFADQAEGVKLMPIAEEPGGDCVEPSAETIQDGSYPISRTLYIYVNKAKAEDNPAVGAFVDAYLADLTTFVEGADYIPLADEAPTQETWESKTVGTTAG